VVGSDLPNQFWDIQSSINSLNGLSKFFIRDGLGNSAVTFDRHNGITAVNRMEVDMNIVPTGTGVYNLGSALFRWNEVDALVLKAGGWYLQETVDTSTNNILALFDQNNVEQFQIWTRRDNFDVTFAEFSLDLAPKTHNFYTLGTNPQRWKNVYGVAGDFTGTLTVANMVVTTSCTGCAAAPANMMTTDTNQTASGIKTWTNAQLFPAGLNAKGTTGASAPVMVQKLEIHDYAGFNAFYEFRSTLSATQSFLALRDSSGLEPQRWTRTDNSGTLLNTSEIDMAFVPLTDNTRRLGRLDRRWSEMHAGVVFFSSTNSSKGWYLQETVRSVFGCNFAGCNDISELRDYNDVTFFKYWTKRDGFDVQFMEANGVIAPMVDNTYALGNTTQRWANINTVSGTFSGGITVGSGATVTGNVSSSTGFVSGGNVGAFGTITCGPGQAVKSFTVHGGLFLIASCGVP
jgi:hypothetical protein